MVGRALAIVGLLVWGASAASPPSPSQTPRYLVRLAYSDSSCSGKAAVGQAFELGKCLALGGAAVEYHLDVAKDTFSIFQYKNSDCTGKHVTRTVSSTSSCVPLEEKKNRGVGGNGLFAKAAALPKPTPDQQQWGRFVTTQNIPDATLGYPYLQTNYTFTRRCNSTIFGTNLIFSSEALNSCMPGPSPVWPQAKAIQVIHGAPNSNVAFKVAYFSSRDCITGSLLQRYSCNSVCTPIDQGSVTCEALHGEDKYLPSWKFRLIAIGSVLGAILVGLGIFIFLRKRAQRSARRDRERRNAQHISPSFSYGSMASSG